MKLKTFEKVNVNTRTEYTVFHDDDPFDSFTVDYLSKDYDAILRRMRYEKAGAVVRFVCVNSATGNLSVTVEI